MAVGNIMLFGGTSEILEFGRVVRTVPIVLQTNNNINNVIKASHDACAKDFIKHMTKLAISAPSMYSHMYEWNMVGAPSAKLWKHVMRGSGRSRTAFFEFIPSKSIVPVHPKLAEVGVKKRHRFAMKAAMMEYGMEVKISPKLAKALVYLAKGDVREESGTPGKGYIKNGIVYRTSTVTVKRAGGTQMWGSFTAAYVDWWSGAGARLAIEEKVIKKMTVSISKTTTARLAKIGKKPAKVPTKAGELNVVGADPELETKLINALYNDYTAEALNRTVI